MNIFKVLASGRKSFSEESASAVLGWLMNPADRRLQDARGLAPGQSSRHRMAGPV
jgi:hypothetical protein